MSINHPRTAVLEELLARVRVRLRDPGSSEQPELSVGDVVLDLRTRKVRVGGEEVELSAREFILAETLFRHPGPGPIATTAPLQRMGLRLRSGIQCRRCLRRYLRRKLGKDLIETVRGMGYRLVDG